MTEYVATRWYRAPEIMLSFANYVSFFCPSLGDLRTASGILTNETADPPYSLLRSMFGLSAAFSPSFSAENLSSRDGSELQCRLRFARRRLIDLNPAMLTNLTRSCTISAPQVKTLYEE